MNTEGSFKKELKTLKDPDSLSAAASVQKSEVLSSGSFAMSYSIPDGRPFAKISASFHRWPTR